MFTVLENIALLLDIAEVSTPNNTTIQSHSLEFQARAVCEQLFAQILERDGLGGIVIHAQRHVLLPSTQDGVARDSDDDLVFAARYTVLELTDDPRRLGAVHDGHVAIH